mmetsp:Transcript_7598/g.11903  ORF Transcript_7598/g.11903 Transcript_7598/m.11903 type:complete len:705 (-) Transcript_7598:5770-7884(-)
MGQSQSLETDDPIIGKSVLVKKQGHILSKNALGYSQVKKRNKFRSHRAVAKKEFSVIALSSDNFLSPKTQATNPETPTSLASSPDLVSMITPIETTHIVATHDNSNTEQLAVINNTSILDSTSKHQNQISHNNEGEIQLSPDLNVHFFPSQELESGGTPEEASTSSDELDYDEISVESSLNEIDTSHDERDQDLSLAERFPERLKRQIKLTSYPQSNTKEKYHWPLTRTSPIHDKISPTANESRSEGNSVSKKQSLSLERHILADFKKLRVKVQLKEHQEKEEQRQAKYNERYADVKCYRRLYAEFEELQLKSKRHQEELDKTEQSKRQLKALDLSQSSSWYFDFQSLDIEQRYFDVGDDQSKYSLLSAPSQEYQIRYYTSKQLLKNVRHSSDSSQSKTSDKSNTKAFLEDIVKGSSENLEKYFPKTAPTKEVDYGPINRRFKQKCKRRNSGGEESKRKQSAEIMSDYGPLSFTAQKHEAMTEETSSTLSLNSIIGISSKLSTVPLAVDVHNVLTESAKGAHLQRQSILCNEKTPSTRLDSYYSEERTNNVSSQKLAPVRAAEVPTLDLHNSDDNDQSAQFLNHLIPQIKVKLIQQNIERTVRDKSPKTQKSIKSQNEVATATDKENGHRNDSTTDCENIHQAGSIAASGIVSNSFPSIEKKEIELSVNNMIMAENEREISIATMSTDKFLHLAEDNTFLRIYC